MNLNTPLANGLEKMKPGVKEGFIQGLTDLAYRDRLPEIAERFTNLLLPRPLAPAVTP